MTRSFSSFRITAPGVVADEPHRMLGDRVSVVVELRRIFGIGEGRDHGVVADQRGRVEVAVRAVDGAVVAVETASQWPVVLFGVGGDLIGDMPFADGVVPVAGRLEPL